MTQPSQPRHRQVIPAGELQSAWRHLVPIAQLLIERGHPPLRERTEDKFGFRPRPDGWVCGLVGEFTAADHKAVLDAFELPPNIVWLGAAIRDTANWTDMYGLARPTDSSSQLRV